MSSPDPNSDAWLDAQLRDVAVPGGLLRSLEGITVMSDEELDASLRDVPLPATLLWRLRRIVEAPTRLMLVRQWATAASLVLAIGLSYVGAMLILLTSLYPAREDGRPRIGGEFPIELTMGEVDDDIFGGFPSVPDPKELAADWEDPDDVLTVPTIALDEFPPARRHWITTQMEPFGGPSARNLLLDRELSLWPSANVRGAHSGFDDLSEIELVPGLAPSGLLLPLVPGVDIGFLRRTGINPLLRPDANMKLTESRVPLAVDTSSYDLASRYLADGMLPPRWVLRTEEFLAAIDYNFPHPKRGSPLNLFTAAGPSPFRGGDVKLLQIGVQAARVYGSSRDGTRLTLVVDVSGSMQWDGRLDMVRRALRKIAPQVGHKDRLALVVFNEYAVAVAEEIAPDEIGQMMDVFDLIPSDGSTNVGAGLRMAYAIAGRYEGLDKRSNRVLLMTDGLAELDGLSSGRIEQRLRAAAARGMHLDAVDLSQEKAEERLDAQLVRFAEAGGGKVHRATNADQVGWAVLESLTGQSQLVASETRLRVVFDPENVLVYRLMGHEARAIIGLVPSHLETSFRSGQSATALYELQLKPGAGNPVATVELTWTDPRSGEPHRLERKIQRSEFNASLAQVPMPLQAATLVAQAAEVLRESPFAMVPQSAGGLARVLELSRQVDSRLYQRPSFAGFVKMLEQAVKAKPYRSGGYK